MTMKNKTITLIEMWLEARTRFSNQLANLSQNDLKKKLGDSLNSVGFLIRHIGDVELLFAKNVFGEGIIIPAHSKHSFTANEQFKMISTIIKSGYEE
jgi:uncharacterized damage-inducible protein DinB